ncbi:hypothetical protein CC80DRAFT_184515 [Byssothecium circinans]|uniref:Uncharacterized protein n=1 Tax=Byssothecium circinans TaxID=147558 RepID=A0A6A5TIL2_9PLEO|nr:hypothetical protein CC80DRAFT_184515 [Byssothecium circinans]
METIATPTSRSKMCIYCKMCPTPPRRRATVPTPPAPPNNPPRSTARPYTIQFLVGNIDGPDSFPRKSVYMPSTIAARSRYLRARIHPPPPGQEIVNVVLTETYHDALKLYKSYLQTGYLPKFRPSLTSPVLTLERTLLWSECFDLIRAHITGTRFVHKEFEDYVMDELVRWLDPQQDADSEVLDFVFAERGVSEKLQKFVVDRMFTEDEQVRRIFSLYLERKREGRIGRFRERRVCEYHAHEEGKCWAERDGGHHFIPEGEFTIESPDLESRDLFFPPLPPSPKIHAGLLKGARLVQREAKERAFARMQEPRAVSPPSPFHKPVPFPPAPYLKSAANHGVAQKFSVRRKPLPKNMWPITPEVEPLQRLTKQRSWPISAVEEERERSISSRVSVDTLELCLPRDNGKDKGNGKGQRNERKTRRSVKRNEGREEGNGRRERRASTPRKLVPVRLAELQGRAVTPEELLYPQRPGSAPC